MEELVLITELKETAYPQFKAKMTELGIPQVWGKGGKKKEDMIAEAVVLLCNKEEVPTAPEQEEEQAVVPAGNDTTDNGTEAPEDTNKEEDTNEQAEVPSTTTLSKEAIERNLTNIKLLLLTATPGVKNILIKKRTTLEAMLKEANKA